MLGHLSRGSEGENRENGKDGGEKDVKEWQRKTGSGNENWLVLCESLSLRRSTSDTNVSK